MWPSRPRGTDAAERWAGDPPSPTPAALGESRPGCSRHPGHRVRLPRKRWAARQEGNAHLGKLARQNRGHTAGAPAAGRGRRAAPVTARDALVDKADDTQGQGAAGGETWTHPGPDGGSEAAHAAKGPATPSAGSAGDGTRGGGGLRLGRCHRSPHNPKGEGSQDRTKRTVHGLWDNEERCRTL